MLPGPEAANYKARLIDVPVDYGIYLIAVGKQRHRYRNSLRVRQIRETARIFFPVLAIEFEKRYRVDGRRIKATSVDAIPFRVGTRNIERLDAAVLAKIVFGSARVKRVESQIVLACRQSER